MTASMAYTLPICMRPDGVGANRPVTSLPSSPHSLPTICSSDTLISRFFRSRETQLRGTGRYFRFEGLISMLREVYFRFKGLAAK